MSNDYGPYTKFNKQEVIGLLKATGSKDKDVLYATKAGLLKVARQTRFNGTIFMVVGVGFAIVLIGIPIFFGGWYWRRRGTSSIKAIEEAYREYAEVL